MALKSPSIHLRPHLRIHLIDIPLLYLTQPMSHFPRDTYSTQYAYLRPPVTRGFQQSQAAFSQPRPRPTSHPTRVGGKPGRVSPGPRIRCGIGAEMQATWWESFKRSGLASLSPSARQVFRSRLVPPSCPITARAGLTFRPTGRP